MITHSGLPFMRYGCIGADASIIDVTRRERGE